MKKLSLLILSTISFILFFIIGKDTYANHSPRTTEMAVKFGSDNGNTEWEVAYRYQFTTEDSRGNPNGVGYTSVWQRWVDQTSNRYIPAVSHTFDRVSYLNVASTDSNGMGPRWGPNSNHHPTYRIQWGTTCFDPKERSVWDTQDISSTYRIYLFVPDVTSSLPGANNSGRRISYAYGNNISSRTDLCPFLHQIQGHVFVDDNGDGNQDRGEADYNTGNTAIEKWGDRYENTGTNSNGFYQFYNLPERSDYGIRLNVPSGYRCTSSNNCRVGCQSQGCGSSGINLPPNRTYNFGIARDEPDLIVSSFRYPGGIAGRSVNPTVIVTNRGSSTVTPTYIVRVCNGDGTCREQPLGQDLEPGRDRDVTTSFAGMPLPSRPGNYTARATVDYGDNVNESNEGNNTRDDAYTTRDLADLDIISFTYPDGPAGAAQGTAIASYINRGGTDIPANSNIPISVCPGGGLPCITRYINRAVPADQTSADAYPVNFTNAPHPASSGTYTAVATIDAGNTFTESNEGNNTANDTYNVTSSAYPISGGVFIDRDNNGAISGADTPYTGTGNITVSPGGRTDQPDSANGTYSILNNPNGNYTVTLSGVPAANYQVLIGSRNVTINNGGASAVNFLVRQIVAPTSFNITGNVYVDDNGTAGLQTGGGSPDSAYTGVIRVRATRTAPAPTGATFDDTTLTSSGGFAITAVPNATYSITIANLAAGYTVQNIAAAPHPRSAVVNGANIGNINFLLTPPIGPPPPPPPPPPGATYTITGGVYYDLDSSGTLAGPLEDYQNATLQITGPGYSSTATSLPGSGFSINNLDAGQYRIWFPVANYPSSNYSATYPSDALPPAQYILNVGPACTPVGPPGNQTSCTGATGGDQSNVNFGIVQPPADPWIKGFGGDMRIDKSYDNPMPGGLFSDILSSPSLTSGIVFGPINLGSGNATWKVNGAYSPGTVKTSYSQVEGSLKKSGDLRESVNLFGGSVSSCNNASSRCSLSPLPTPGKVYTSSHDVIISNTNPIRFNGGTYLFLINGNLRIEQEIQVAPGSVAIFIVKGNITVAGNVNRIEGIYSADNNFTAELNSANQSLNIAGNIIANAAKNGGAFDNKRDLGSSNSTTPSIITTYRPDFILNAPDLIKYTNYKIIEVAPGSD